MVRVSELEAAETTTQIRNTGSRTNFVRVAVDKKPEEIARITEIAQQGFHIRFPYAEFYCPRGQRYCSGTR